MGMDVTTLSELLRAMTTIAGLFLREKLQALARSGLVKRTARKLVPTEF
jgi:DNA-binding HxlR family transcriptional regulator